MAQGEKRAPSWCWLFLLVPFALLVPYVLLGHDFGFDESYHVTAAKQFFHAMTLPETFPATLRDYDSPAGPLTFVIWGLWGAVAGFSPVSMRLLMLAVSAMDVLLLYHIAKEQKMPYPLVAALLLLTSPYFFLTSFMAMTQNFAMVFGLASLLVFLRGAPDDRRQLLLAVVLGTMATLCRQVWVFLPAAMGITWFIEKVKAYRRTDRQALEVQLKTVAAEAGILLIAPVVMGTLFAYWGGFTNQAWSTRYRTIYDGLGLDARVDQLHAQPAFANLFLAFVGAYFGVSLLLSARNWKRSAICTAAAMPLFFLFTPVYGFGGGMILRTADFLNRSAFLHAGTAMLLLLWTMGSLVLAGTLFRQSPAPPGAEAGLPARTRRLLFLSLAFFVTVNVAGSRMWERYMIEAVPFLVLLCFDRIDRRRWLLFTWVAVQAAVAVGYAGYKCLYQFGNQHMF